MGKLKKHEEQALQILRELHKAGGCDAADDFSKGWDEAIGEAIKIVSNITKISIEDAIWKGE